MLLLRDTEAIALFAEEEEVEEEEGEEAAAVGELTLALALALAVIGGVEEEAVGLNRRSSLMA